MSRDSWQVITTATDGSTSVTYGPSAEWAQHVVDELADRPGIVAVEASQRWDTE